MSPHVRIEHCSVRMEPVGGIVHQWPSILEEGFLVLAVGSS